MKEYAVRLITGESVTCFWAGLVCRVNWQIRYDMDFEGPFYSMVQFVRDCAQDWERLEGTR